MASLGLVHAYEWVRNGRSPLTMETLRKVYPTLGELGAQAYLYNLNAALWEGSILSPARLAAFLAQVGYESGELRYWVELGKDAGAAYEGRSDLGNTEPGDGRRYKGRGPIQLTGRANYTAASKALGYDFVKSPDAVAEPAEGFRVAVWFWNSRGLSQLADKNTPEAFEAITRKVNGGLNGQAQRLEYWKRARQVLGA